MEEEAYVYEEVMEVEGEEVLEVDASALVDPYAEGIEYVEEEVYQEEVLAEGEGAVEYVVEEVLEEVSEDAFDQASREAVILSQCRDQLAGTEVEADASAIDLMDYDEDPDEFGGPAVVPVTKASNSSASSAPPRAVVPAPVTVAAEPEGEPAVELRPCENGYLFVCSNATDRKCELNQLVGSPEWEINQMQRCIKEGGATAIFLLNLQSLTLYGPLKAVGAPRRNINYNAFDGKYTSQVRVAPESDIVWQVQVASRIKSGPKTIKEVIELRNKLWEGEPLPEDRQHNWSKPQQQPKGQDAWWGRGSSSENQNGKRPLQSSSEQPWKQQRVSMQDAKASPFIPKQMAPKAALAKPVLVRPPAAKPVQPQPAPGKAPQPAALKAPAKAPAKAALAKAAVAKLTVAKAAEQPAAGQAALTRPTIAAAAQAGHAVVRPAVTPASPRPATSTGAARQVVGIPAPKLGVAKAPVAAAAVGNAGPRPALVKVAGAPRPALAKAGGAASAPGQAVAAKAVVAKPAVAKAPVAKSAVKAALPASAVGKAAVAAQSSGALAPAMGKAPLAKAPLAKVPLARPPAAGAAAAVTGQAAAVAAAKAAAAKAAAQAAAAKAAAAKVAAERAAAAKAAAAKAAAEKASAAKAAAERAAAAKAARASTAVAPVESFEVGEAVILARGEYEGSSASILSIEDGDITVLINGTDVVVASAGDLRKAAAVEAQVIEDAAEDPEAIRASLLAKREELRQLIVRPDHIVPFLNRGRLVYMRDAANNDVGWGILLAAAKGADGRMGVKVFTAPSDKPAGQMRSLPLSRLQKISKVRTNLPAAASGQESAQALLDMLNKVRNHKTFSVEGIPELDPIKEMNIKDTAAASLVAAIAEMETKLAEMGVSAV